MDTDGEIDPEKQINMIQGQLQKIEEQRDEVTKNAEEMETYLRELFKTALVNLHDITQLKVSSLLSVEAELRRRAEEVEWMDEFIAYQKEMVAPVAFLDSYSQHSLVKKERFKELSTVSQRCQQVLATVSADITAKGELSVHSPSQDLNLHFKPIMLENAQGEKEEEEAKGIIFDESKLLHLEDRECIIS